MSNYSDEPSSIRVDFFRESGKWYTTEAVFMDGPFDDGDLYRIFIEAVVKHCQEPNGTIRLEGMWAVCLDPYHRLEHPLMRKVPTKQEWDELCRIKP